MFRLRRLYFDSIGVPDNRFSDLTVSFSDLDGNPADTIVWLRNGAGKTTMLSLLLALIRPDRRDFLATRVKKRTLEDLVLGSDTAHVVAEWVDLSGQVLCTGAVYEWDGRARPRDYNTNGKDRLHRLWWAMHPDPSVEGATLEELPFTLRSRGKADLAVFRGHIRALAARGVNAVIADDSIVDWHAALRERRFDPDLFRFFGEVNATEGGIDALFSGIDSPGAFVRYLLRFVGDERRAAPVRDLLADNAMEIAKRPAYTAERDFCAQAQPKVSALGEANTRVVETIQRRDEVRSVAGAYRRALLDAAAVADGRAETSAARRRELEGAVREARTASDASRRQRDEYHRLAAGFRLDAARVAVEGARAHARRAVLDEAAWRTVAELNALAEAQAQLQVRRDTLAAAAATSAPLVAQVDRARSILAAALEARIAEANDRLAALVLERDAAEAERTAADAARRAAQGEVVRLGTEQRSLTATVERFETRLRAAAAAGMVATGERAETAARRIAAEIDRAVAAQNRLDATELDSATALTGARHARAEASEAATKAGAERDILAGELERLERRNRALAALDRVRAFLQADHVDPIAEADDLATRLGAAVAAADAETLALHLEGADDDFAIHALAGDGLLPPRPAVAQVIAALAERGITSHPGWRYLAEHEPVERHPELIARLPEVVDGVVVYGDPVAARVVLDGVEVTDAVVLAPATVFGHDGGSRVVVGPAPARHDRGAAAEELARRRARSDARAAHLARLGDRRRADAEIAAQLAALIADVPRDGIDGLRRRRQDATDRAAGLADDAELAAELVTLAVEEAEAATAAARDGRARLGALRTTAAQVEALATDERDLVGPARARLSALPDLLRAAGEAEVRGATRHAEAESRLEEVRNHLRSLDATRRQWVTERAPLPAAADGPAPSVDVARVALDEADRQLRDRFPEHELRRAVDDGETAVRAAAAKVNTEHAVRARAEGFVASEPAAGDEVLRREAEEAAHARALDAAGLRANAERELADAQAEVAETKAPPDRPRHAEVPVEPVDRADALRRAASANEDAAQHQSVVVERERERDAAGAEAERAGIRAGLLRDQAGVLRDVEVAPVAQGDVSDVDADVRNHVHGLAAEVDTADAAYNSAMSLRSRAAELLRSWAGADRFALVAEDEHGRAVRLLRELFRGDQLFERVAPRAGELAADLANRHRLIGQLLAEVEVHKRNVVTRLAGLVDDALGDLARASALSELGDDIGPWAGQRFLIVEPRQRPTAEQIEVRVADLIDRMVAVGRVELDTIEMLWKATEAAVTDGFRASVLKPAPDQPTGRTPVEDMRKWSGGENLTASLVLFCVMAKLRAEKRTGTRAGTAGGVVPLDNPLGKANYLPFLELQRRVAAANGVQLVFWTGIGDLGAVTTFPRIAAMHKRPSTSRAGAAYVTVDGDASYTGRSQVLDVVTAGRRDD